MPSLTRTRRWRRRLNGRLRALREASPLRAWRLRVEIRVLRYLLARYGHSEQGREATQATERDESRMSFWSAEVPAAVPRDALARIRSTLRTVHEANSAQPVGPLRDGARPDSMVVATVVGDPAEARRVRKALRAKDIPCRFRRRRGEIAVLTPLEAFVQAKETVARLRIGPPRPGRSSRTGLTPSLWLWGVCLPCCVCLFTLAFVFYPLEMISGWRLLGLIASVLVGCVVGWIYLAWFESRRVN